MHRAATSVFHHSKVVRVEEFRQPLRWCRARYFIFMWADSLPSAAAELAVQPAVVRAAAKTAALVPAFMDNAAEPAAEQQATSGQVLPAAVLLLDR